MTAAGVTEELKACEQMTWVGRMNAICAQVEEIVHSTDSVLKALAHLKDLANAQV